MDRYEKVQRRILEALEELQGCIEELLREAADPTALAGLMKSLGPDASFLLGISGLSAASSFDPYRVLGLEKTASDGEVKRRYRELVHKLHPDTAGVQGTEFLLGVVMAAYRQISRQRGWQS